MNFPSSYKGMIMNKTILVCKRSYESNYTGEYKILLHEGKTYEIEFNGTDIINSKLIYCICEAGTEAKRIMMDVNDFSYFYIWNWFYGVKESRELRLSKILI